MIGFIPIYIMIITMEIKVIKSCKNAQLFTGILLIWYNQPTAMVKFSIQIYRAGYCSSLFTFAVMHTSAVISHTGIICLSSGLACTLQGAEVHESAFENKECSHIAHTDTSQHS